MEYMLRKEKRRRTQEGKNTIFTHNYREVEHEKLDRFRKRRKLQDDDIGSSIICRWSNLSHYYYLSNCQQLNLHVSSTLHLQARALTQH